MVMMTALPGSAASPAASPAARLRQMAGTHAVGVEVLLQVVDVLLSAASVHHQVDLVIRDLCTAGKTQRLSSGTVHKFIFAIPCFSSCSRRSHKHYVNANCSMHTALWHCNPTFKSINGFTITMSPVPTLVTTVSSMMPPCSLVNMLREPAPLGMPAMSPTTSCSRKGTASLPCWLRKMSRQDATARVCMRNMKAFKGMPASPFRICEAERRLALDQSISDVREGCCRKRL